MQIPETEPWALETVGKTLPMNHGPPALSYYQEQLRVVIDSLGWRVNPLSTEEGFGHLNICWALLSLRERLSPY